MAQGQVFDVVDGDTFDLSNGTRVRIAIADTPEVFGGFEPCGAEASDFTKRFLVGETVAVYRPDGAPLYDPFDRLLGEVVRLSDGASLNVELITAGLAVIDDRFVDEDPDLARRLRAAADSAYTPQCATQGQTSPTPEPSLDSPVVISLVREDGPGNDVEVYNDSEYVQLRNSGEAEVDISGWMIVDLAGNSVTIGGDSTIPAGSSFRVYSGAGDDDPRARYFAGLSQAYLNNSGGDTIRLLNSTGGEIDSFTF